MAKRRVLVVDDLEDTAVSLAFLIESMGHEVRFVTDPMRAIDMAKAFSAEFAFLDIGMPKLDGWKLGELLKSEPTLPDLRIFAITGYGMESDRQRSREAGFEDHFTKPLDVSAIERVLGSTPN